MGDFSRWYWLGTGYHTTDCYVIVVGIGTLPVLDQNALRMPRAALGRYSEVSRDAAAGCDGCLFVPQNGSRCAAL